ncbi:Oxygen-dependent choline dehydrogenase [Kutzneria sp. CA-103260]|nr:Oxygen-dependent choline dehydrogenase [Kutzneria sp. CA-103260]
MGGPRGSVVETADVVVVGSGFGGSVAAHRLADAGLSVVVLERGRAWPPNSFARTPEEMRHNFWNPEQADYGLFDVLEFRGFDSVVSAGLGGGSLIYANVLLRKDERWFVQDSELPGGGYETWPVTREDLDPHYDTVEAMLTPSRYPFDDPQFAGVPKTEAFQEAAAALGLDYQLPPLAVAFAPKPGAQPGIALPIIEPSYGNLHGQPRRTCRLCGECDFGCNDGAKNSLDHTYLSAAKAAGADLRTMCEVQAIRPGGPGYQVRYLLHAMDGSSVSKRIDCERLVLAAGSFGTTRLLLGNRAHLPGLSAALGTRFSGNGDMLSFALHARRDGRPRPMHASRGPVITSTIRVPDELDEGGGIGRGFYIQDSGYPVILDWLVQNMDVRGDLSRLAGFSMNRLRAALRWAGPDHLEHGIGQLIGSGSLSNCSLPLLGMGRDVPDGVMRLRDGELDVSWTTATSRDYIDRVRDTMRAITGALGGEYLDNPLWFRKRLAVAHPLGGAPIGRHPGEGVCDSYGEVFGHPGLYVADGAAMPGPVGANPSLTIAAMADRLCDHLLLTRGMSGRSATRGGRRRSGGTTQATPAAPARLSGGRTGAAALSFTEEMAGQVTLGEREGQTSLRIRVTVAIEDMDAFLADPRHEARARGFVDCPALGGRLLVSTGRVELMVTGEGGGRRRMRYRLPFTDGGGRELVLSGHKELRAGAPTAIWPDTTTLHTKVLSDGVVLGAGELRLGRMAFLRELTTIRASGRSALERFGTFFLGSLWQVYRPRLTS